MHMMCYICTTDIDMSMKTLKGLSFTDLRVAMEEDFKYLVSRTEDRCGRNHVELSDDEKHEHAMTGALHPIDHVYIQDIGDSSKLYPCDVLEVCRRIKIQVHMLTYSLTSVDVLRYRSTKDGIRFGVIGPKDAFEKAIEYETKLISKGTLLLQQRRFKSFNMEYDRVLFVCVCMWCMWCI